MNPLQKTLVHLIEKYQARGGGSAQFRVACNFEPSCSEYARQAIVRFGVVKGMRLSIRRVRRCNVRDQVSKSKDPVPLKV